MSHFMSGSADGVVVRATAARWGKGRVDSSRRRSQAHEDLAVKKHCTLFAEGENFFFNSNLSFFLWFDCCFCTLMRRRWYKACPNTSTASTNLTKRTDTVVLSDLVFI